MFFARGDLEVYLVVLDRLLRATYAIAMRFENNTVPQGHCNSHLIDLKQWTTFRLPT